MFTFFKKYTKITEAEKGKSPARKKQRRFFREKGQKTPKNSLGKSDSSHPAAQNGAAIKYLYTNARTGRSDTMLEICRNFVPRVLEKGSLQTRSKRKKLL